jgi:ligand-binding sensor domain-containing protein
MGWGVSRFDGKRWTNFTTKDGLAGNIVYSMAQDAKGVFWFGTNNGITRYDGKSWRSLGIKDGLLDKDVYAVAVVAGGDIWAGTRRGVARIGH